MTVRTIGFAAVLATAPAQGQEMPASELEEEDYADEYGGRPAPSNAESSRGSVIDESDTWESYSDLSRVSSVAEDITDGIRVEDIVEPPSEYRYAAFGKPDPFVPPMVTQAEKVDAVDLPGAIEIPIVSMLQKHDLALLRIVGIYSVRSGERKALVTTPDGDQAAVSVKIGDPIGNRGGKVLAIGPQAVTVREFTLAADGTRQFDDMEMFLGEADERATGARIRFEPGSSKTEIIENDNVVRAVEEGAENRAGAVNEPEAALQMGLPNAPASPKASLPLPVDMEQPAAAKAAALQGGVEQIPAASGTKSSKPAGVPGQTMLPGSDAQKATNTQPAGMGETTSVAPVPPKSSSTKSAPAAIQSNGDYEGYDY